MPDSGAPHNIPYLVASDPPSLHGITTSMANQIHARLNKGLQYYAAGYRSTTQSIPNATPTAVSMDFEHADSNGMITIGSQPTRITIQTAGLYMFTVDAQLAGSVSSGIAYIEQDSDSGQRSPIGGLVSSAAGTLFNGSMLTTCDPGDYFRLLLQQSSGGSVNATLRSFSALRIGPV